MPRQPRPPRRAHVLVGCVGVGMAAAVAVKGGNAAFVCRAAGFPSVVLAASQSHRSSSQSLSLFCSGPYLLSQLIGALGSELYTLSFTLSSLCSARSFSKQDIPDLLCPELSREQSSSCASLGLK